MIFYGFRLEHCMFFNVLFSRCKELLSLKLSISHNTLVDYTFVNRDKT